MKKKRLTCDLEQRLRRLCHLFTEASTSAAGQDADRRQVLAIQNRQRKDFLLSDLFTFTL